MASEEIDPPGDGSAPSADKNFQGHLPLHWLMPKDHEGNESADTLASFRDLRLKTHRTLYGTTATTTANLAVMRDKSPKGSVDAPIRHLVDLLNSHSRFCTLSSCSGRLSLFDPNGGQPSSPHHESNNNKNESNHQFTEASGKGRGSWALVSHEQVAPEALVEAMAVSEPALPDPCDSNESNGSNGSSNQDQDQCYPGSGCTAPEQLPWTFRFEPLLLHVAAASLLDGRKLLTIALNLGFRESGLVVTDKRVTVAIRSNSLATAVPLMVPAANQTVAHDGFSSSLCAPASFLRALVHDANRRLEANWENLDRLYRAIESTLFEIRTVPPPLMVRGKSNHKIPSLNLWSAAAIGPDTEWHPEDDSSPQESTRQAIWILGGYGCGPATASARASSAAKRSSKAYTLERELPHGSWNGWKPYNQSSSASGEDFLEVGARGTEKPIRLGISWRNEKAFPDLQGTSSCRWKESGLVLIWGGRQSPSKPSPSNVLYVLGTANDATSSSSTAETDTVSTSRARVGTVQDVRGELPAPRWGHKLVALSGNRAVLLGGCNQDDGALGDIFVLHLCGEATDTDGSNDDSVHGYLCWERLSIRLPTPRFHFGAALLNSDTVLVLGGLESTNHLLQPFEADHTGSFPSTAVWACRFGMPESKTNDSPPKTQTSVLRVEAADTALLGSFKYFFGMDCCTLLSKNLLLVTGGIQQKHTAAFVEPLQAYWISRKNASTLRIQSIELGYDCGGSTESKFDFGSLVHHSCLPIADDEFLLVGGGAVSFAFGESYALTHHLLIDTDISPANKRTNETAKNYLETNRTANVVPGDPKTSNDQNTAPKDSSHGGEIKEKAPVVYVAPKHARQAKNSLQKKGWLEKRYRMIKVCPENLVDSDETKHSSVEDNKDDAPAGPVIAIPVSAPFSEIVSFFGELILRHGEEELPLSTSQYASKKRK